MNNSILSVSDIAGVVAGAGIAQLQSNVNLALILIGVGVGLKVLVAVLNKYDVPISFAKSKK